MPQSQINRLLDLWAASLRALDPNSEPPFANHQDLLSKIDRIPHAQAPWDYFKINYTGEIPGSDPPAWMMEDYVVWYRNALAVVTNMLDNPDFVGEFDYVAYKDYNEEGKRQYQNLMSGDWANRQSVRGFQILCQQ